MTQTTEYQDPLAGLNVIDFGYAGNWGRLAMASHGGGAVLHFFLGAGIGLSRSGVFWVDISL